MGEEVIRKEEVEKLLGYGITNKQFAEALECAIRKQAYIYGCEGRRVVLQRWYLVKLAEEYARSIVLSEFTMELCRKIRNMEKEHLFNEPGAPMYSHILADSDVKIK